MPTFRSESGKSGWSMPSGKPCLSPAWMVRGICRTALRFPGGLFLRRISSRSTSPTFSGEWTELLGPDHDRPTAAAVHPGNAADAAIDFHELDLVRGNEIEYVSQLGGPLASGCNLGLTRPCLAYDGTGAADARRFLVLLLHEVHHPPVHPDSDVPDGPGTARELDLGSSLTEEVDQDPDSRNVLPNELGRVDRGTSFDVLGADEGSARQPQPAAPEEIIVLGGPGELERLGLSGADGDFGQQLGSGVEHDFRCGESSRTEGYPQELALEPDSPDPQDHQSWSDSA